MARLKMSEYGAKRLLLGDAYTGIAVTDTKWNAPAQGTYAVKVDQGIKKRLANGLVALAVPASRIQRALNAWRKKGYSRFLVEQMISHSNDEERYISFDRVRNGIRVLYAPQGGVDIEKHRDSLRTYLIQTESDIPDVAKKTSMPSSFIKGVITHMNAHFLAFVEINPLIIRDGSVELLDAAVLVDSAGEYFVKSWNADVLVQPPVQNKSEMEVVALQKTTASSFKLNVLNPNGKLFFLLSGGGGSIVVLDEIAKRGRLRDAGNYGEYSGGPTQAETYLYTRTVLQLLLASKARKKALVIAGSIANFTDVHTTFLGVIDALREVSKKLQKAHVRVFVRRGGPNEEVGLTHMKTFLKEHGLYGSVTGSSSRLTDASDKAIAYIEL